MRTSWTVLLELESKSFFSPYWQEPEMGVKWVWRTHRGRCLITIFLIHIRDDRVAYGDGASRTRNQVRRPTAALQARRRAATAEGAHGNVVTELAVAGLATVDLDEILLAQVECLRDEHGPAYLHGGPRRISQIGDRVAGAGAYQAQCRADFAAFDIFII